MIFIRLSSARSLGYVHPPFGSIQVAFWCRGQADVAVEMGLYGRAMHSEAMSIFCNNDRNSTQSIVGALESAKLAAWKTSSARTGGDARVPVAQGRCQAEAYTVKLGLKPVQEDQPEKAVGLNR